MEADLPQPSPSPSSPPPTDPRGRGKDERVAEAVAEYLDSLARGDAPDPQRVVGEHPDIALELEKELETLKAFDTAFEPDLFLALRDFEILREVGRGGMGVVYEARQKSLERRVALKVLPPGLLADSRAVARFEREARLAAKLHHPNIVTVYGLEVESGAHFFTMELVEGKTLDEAARDPAAAAAGGDAAYYTRLAEAFAGAADGLHHAHSQGVTHRDLKPSNLILDADGRLRILDFGLARLEGQERVTLSGELLGTPLYMSPEQVEAKAPLDRRTDIYSLGVALYEAAARRPPFAGKDASDTLRQIVASDPRPPRRWVAEVPRDLETIILKCLRKAPAERYTTAEALAQDLRRFARGEPIEARPQAAWEILARLAQRNKGRIAGVAAALFLALTTGLLLASYVRDSRRETRRLYAEKVTQGVLEMQLARPLAPGGGAGDAGRAEEEDASGDPARQAVHLLEEAVELLPGEPEARYHLARGLRLLGRAEEALEQLSRAIAAHPGFTPAVVLRAALLAEGDAASGGEQHIALPDAGRDPQAQAWLKAHRATLAADWKAAAEGYTELIDARRDGAEAYLGSSAEVYLGRGAARRMTGNFLGALEDQVTAQALWPEALEPGLLVGETYHLLGRKDLAEETFERLHRRARFRDATALRIARVLHELRDFEMTLAWAERVEDAEARELARSDALRHLGRPAEALEAAQKAADQDPASLRARNALGLALFDLERLDDAAAEFRKATGLDPAYSRARNGLGMVLEAQEDLEGAVEQYREAVRIDSRNQKAHNNLGAALFRLGRVGEAIEEYRAALRLNPRYAWARRNLAVALERKGQAKEAVDVLRAGLRFDPEDLDSRTIIGLFLNSERRSEDAILEYREVLRRDANHAAAHNNLAVSLRALSRFEEAAAEFTRAFEIEPRNSLFAGNLKGALDALLASIPAGGEPSPGEREVLLRAAEALARSGRSDPELLGAVARIRALEKDFPAAVVALEDAVRLPEASRGLLEELARCRRACLPDLVSLASVDAALDEGIAQVIIREGDPWSYTTGPAEPSPPLEWTLPGFDDAAWPKRPSGFGYGDGDDATLLEAMKGATTALYVRRAFEAPQGELRRLVLSVRADDGFVAYLNGVEVGRGRAGAPGSRVPASGTADANAPEPLVPIDLTLEPARLQPGRNVLAIQGLNRSLDSSDFSLIPVLRAERAPGPQELTARLDAFRAAADGAAADGAAADGAAASGGAAKLRLLYMEARVRELKGRQSEALEALERLLARDEARASSPEAWIRLAKCLSAAGRAVEAEPRVRVALAGAIARGGGAGAWEDLWESWLELAFVGLKLGPAEVLARFPAGGEKLQGRAADARWLLERLAQGEPLRIHCGGRDHRSREGDAWSRDRFFTAGVRIENPRDGSSGSISPAAVAGTRDPALYRWQRSFPDGSIGAPGYHLPLPPGRYRVVLGFAELFERQPQRRRFDVRLEGRTVLADYEPLSAGFATASEREFEIEVKDGFLDLDFLRKTGDPSIALLEVEPAR